MDWKEYTSLHFYHQVTKINKKAALNSTGVYTSRNIPQIPAENVLSQQHCEWVMGTEAASAYKRSRIVNKSAVQYNYSEEILNQYH